MRKLVFASANPGKIREANEILEGRFDVIPAAEAGVTEEIPETGATIEENSVQKAVYLYEHTGLDCFADDTGLEVEALGGEKHFFEGIMEGQIATERRGSGGFGYDPVFLPDGCDGLSSAEISEDHKNAISHRGKALRALAKFLLKREV